MTFETNYDFTPYPKTPRLFGGKCIITEKLNGSNGVIIVRPDGSIQVGSRSRVITPGKTTDNFGFAAWVDMHQGVIRDCLGVGFHRGEWVGDGIQQNPYELNTRVFALFNPDKAGALTQHATKSGLCVVPTIYRGPLKSDTVDMCFDFLTDGSEFSEVQYTEGLCVYHVPLGQVFKVTWAMQREEYQGVDATPDRYQERKA